MEKIYKLTTDVPTFGSEHYFDSFNVALSWSRELLGECTSVGDPGDSVRLCSKNGTTLGFITQLDVIVA